MFHTKRKNQDVFLKCKCKISSEDNNLFEKSK
jgi:hypothetical protein